MAIDHSHLRRILVLLLCFVPAVMQKANAQISLSQAERRPVEFADLDRWIKQLDHPSFQSRQSASRQLFDAALRKSIDESWQVDANVVASLERALSHESLEVRLATSSLLDQITLADRDRQLERLVNLHCDAASIRLPHWKAFAELVGEDLPARTAFAAIARRLGEGRRVPAVGRTVDLARPANQLDPFRLDPQDTTGWLMLLMFDLRQRRSAPYLAPRIAIAMSHCPMGPISSASVDAGVLTRLIDRWVRESGRRCGNRERLMIAMRYDCLATAHGLCQQILEDETSPAATSVTALLAASVLDRDDLPTQAIHRLHDHRIAHVWQLMPARKTKIRTQVRDVALAVLLHHHGVDPRSVGFGELQADPLLRFRDHSLGFPDEASRVESRHQAWLRIPGPLPGP